MVGDTLALPDLGGAIQGELRERHARRKAPTRLLVYPPHALRRALTVLQGCRTGRP
jgi:hypothetical protein